MTSSRSPLRSFVVILMLLALLIQTVVPETGQAKRRQRVGPEVVNGSDVAAGQYPFVAAVGYGPDPLGGFLWDNQFCGGSLVAASLVLTAAHCVEGVTAAQLTVVVGRTVMTSTEGQVRRVTEIIRDPNYSPSSGNNDLAVLRLNQPVVGITPIKLAGVGDSALSAPGAPLTITGWGDARADPLRGKESWWPDVMQQAHVNVVDDATCAKEWGRTGFDNDSVWHLFLCTTARTFGSGDSGGPLFASTPNGYVQVSLVSGSYAKKHKHKHKKKQKKLYKIIPDYGPELTDPSIAAFLASINP